MDTTRIMLNIQKVLRFTKKDLDKHGKEISDAHKAQTEMGVDFEGKAFASYTQGYRKNKASGKAVKGQKSTQVEPPNLKLTGAMLDAFKFIRSGFPSGELGILYGIKDKLQATKLKDNQLGKFGNARKRKNIIKRPDKARVIVRNNKIGPIAEKEVVKMFADVIRNNVKKINKRHTVKV